LDLAETSGILLL